MQRSIIIAFRAAHHFNATRPAVCVWWFKIIRLYLITVKKFYRSGFKRFCSQRDYNSRRLSPTVTNSKLVSPHLSSLSSAEDISLHLPRYPAKNLFLFCPDPIQEQSRPLLLLTVPVTLLQTSAYKTICQDFCSSSTRYQRWPFGIRPIEKLHTKTLEGLGLFTTFSPKTQPIQQDQFSSFLIVLTLWTDICITSKKNCPLSQSQHSFSQFVFYTI